MKPVWIAFIVGLFIGANLSVVLMCLLKMASDCDRHLPDIEDVQAEK